MHNLEIQKEILENIPQCFGAGQQYALFLWWSGVGSQSVGGTAWRSPASDVPRRQSGSSFQPGKEKDKGCLKWTSFSFLLYVLKTKTISINLTCMLAISLCSRTRASWATASCCWYHCLTCWSESISAWDVFSRLWRVLRSSWTCWSWLWRPPICWRNSWTTTFQSKKSNHECGYANSLSPSLLVRELKAPEEILTFYCYTQLCVGIKLFQTKSNQERIVSKRIV